VSDNIRPWAELAAEVSSALEQLMDRAKVPDHELLQAVNAIEPIAKVANVLRKRWLDRTIKLAGEGRIVYVIPAPATKEEETT